MNDASSSGSGGDRADPRQPAVPPGGASTPAGPDGAGRDGSPDRGGRPADGSNAGEEFGSGGFGGYQGGNQADARGGDAGGLPDPGHDGAGLPADREKATLPPDRS